MQEENLPLIPKPTAAENHDVEHVLRDVFQEVLEKPKYPINVAKNLLKNNVVLTQMKDGAENVEKIMKYSMLSMEDIGIVEEKIMYRQGEYLVYNNRLEKNKCHQEKLLLRRLPLIKPIDRPDLQQYSLIQGDDLLPDLFRKTMDFSINENEHKCMPCISNPDLISDSPEITQEKSKSLLLVKRQQRILKTPALNPFRLSTDKVVFCNYGVNKVYKKRFRLQNVSNVAQTFFISTYPKTKYFAVDIEENNNRISPGLSATFIITFQTDNYLDIQDAIVINCTTVSTEDSTDVHWTVLLASYRDAPNLFMYVYKNVFPTKNSSTQFDISRSIALNNSIDCGASFLSQRSQIYLIVKNNGGDGKFFFMTEENWFESNINNLHTTLDLEAGCFIVTPAYFEIKSNEYLVISIEFSTKLKGVNLEKLILLCNNSTHEKLDVIADGVIFDRYSININKQNLLPLEQLAYILYVPKEQWVAYEGIGEGDVFYKELSALKNILDPDYTDYRIMSSNNLSSTENHFIEPNPKTSSEAILAYLRNTKQDIPVQGETTDYEHYHYRYLLYFESVVPLKNNIKKITIHNNCLVDLNYYWKVDDTCSELLGYDNLKDLDQKYLELSSTTNFCFPSYSSTEFDIIISPDFCTGGFYRLVLNLYIRAVPKYAVEDLEHFIKVEFPDSDLVDILIAAFDIVCRISPMNIEFHPPEIVSKTPLEYDEIYESSFLVKVLTEDKDLMECYWSIKNENIQIQPMEFTMKDDENIQFNLKVHNTSYYNITDSAILIVNKIYTKELPIHVKVKRPVLKFQCDVLDLGWFVVGNKYRIKFIILNDNYISVSWEIWEKYCEDLISNNVNISVTNLEDNNIEVEYIIDATEEIAWESQLIIYTLFNEEKFLDSTCLLKYNVSKLEVHLHTPMSQCPILSPKQVLYINTQYSYVLCLHNTGNIPTYYFFGKPSGLKAEFMDVEIIRSVGYLEAKSIQQVDIKIIPKTVGVVDEVYVPCFLKTCNSFLKEEEKEIEPVVLMILFVAEDILVNVTFPDNKDGIQEVITWPPQMIYDFDDEHVDYEPLDGDENEGESEVLLEKSDNILNEKECDFINDVSKYLNSIMYPHVEEGDDEDSNMQVPDNSQETSELSSYSSVTMISSESLRHRFRNKDFVLQEHIIELLDIPIHKVIRRTILIENCTPIVGNLNAETINFNPIAIQKRKIDYVLEEINLKQFDDSNQMLTEYGIWIKAEPKTKVLTPFGTIEIELSLYANTWGTYAEELLIEINDILPLCISVLVDVTGLPLQFANCKNTLQKYPLFRFGRLPYKSKEVNRKIFFKNVSFVPISITWHIFLKTKDVNNQPITLVFDIFHPNLELKLSEHDSMGNLMIMHGKYFGNTEQCIFNIEPKEIFINSGDTKYLDITFNPKAYGANFKHKRVEAYLIGYVQIAKQFRHQPNIFLRKFGSQMAFLKMKLTATLELPLLILELLVGDLTFIYYATNVMNGEYKQVKTLCFKNFHSTDAVVSMAGEDLLEVEAMRTTNGKSVNNTVLVSPGESVEVQISYVMNQELLTNVAETLYNVNYDPNIINQLDFEKYSYKITKYIHIKQKGTIKQHVPIEIITYFPYMEMTSELDFGFVFIGNNKKQILTIRNYTSCRVPFKLESTGDLIINPAVGMIDSAKHDMPAHIDVSVIFIPKVYKVYLETILMNTNVPGLVRTASVRAIGTHDEKHFSHDQC